MASRLTYRILDDYITGTNPLETPIGVLLTSRCDLLGKPDPTRWRSGDVHELLIQYCAPRQIDIYGVGRHALDAVRDYLLFLDQSGLMHPGSTKAGTLLKELDRLAPKFGPAMADRSRWWLAKRMLTAMIEDGVDLGDEDAMDRWARVFSALPAEERRQVLGELMTKDPRLGTTAVLVNGTEVAFVHSPPEPCKHRVWSETGCTCGTCLPVSYPPDRLPDDEELAKEVAAHGTEYLSKLVHLADLVGEDGLPVDQHGQPRRDASYEIAEDFRFNPAGGARMRDIPQLRVLWNLALEFGIIEFRHARAVPGSRLDLARHVIDGQAGADDTLDLWHGVFAEICSPATLNMDGRLYQSLREEISSWPIHFLTELYLRIPAEEYAYTGRLVRTILDNHHPGIDELVKTVIDLALSYLDEHGAVELYGSPWEQEVRLTDLGRYAVRRQLLPSGDTQRSRLG
jgi:hypothetical protein